MNIERKNEHADPKRGEIRDSEQGSKIPIRKEMPAWMKVLLVLSLAMPPLAIFFLLGSFIDWLVKGESRKEESDSDQIPNWIIPLIVAIFVPPLLILFPLVYAVDWFVKGRDWRNLKKKKLQTSLKGRVILGGESAPKWEKVVTLIVLIIFSIAYLLYVVVWCFIMYIVFTKGA